MSDSVADAGAEPGPTVPGARDDERTQAPDHRPPPRGLRLLGWFWAGLVVLSLAGAGLLQWLGPPRQATAGPDGTAPPLHAIATKAVDAGPGMAGVPARPPSTPSAAGDLPPAKDGAAASAPPAVTTADTGHMTATTPAPKVAAGPPAHPTAHPGDPIPPPDPALQEAAPDLPGLTLPKIGPDGRAPRLAYAAGADTPDARPRVAFLISGIGLSEPESDAAIRATPAAVSLAFSPYAVATDKLLEQARAGGHETLVSLPMEPQGYPLNDAGNRALLTGNAGALNRQRLIWTLARFPGYVGATNALGGGLRGERFAGFDEQMSMVLDELAARGLLYIDARPGMAQPARITGRSVDVIIDEPTGRADIEAKLAALEQQARDHGSALGLATEPQPVTVDRIAAWTHTLAMRGLALVPVSALALPPQPWDKRNNEQERSGE